MKFFLTILIASLSVSAHHLAYSQSVHLKGHVKSATEGSLIGASVSVKELNKGVLSDASGNFSISLEKGDYTLNVVYYGYKNYEQKIHLESDMFVEVILTEDVKELEEVKIETKAKNENVKSTDIGVVHVDLEQMKKLPSLLGEVDVIKNIQMMPGVQVAGEGNTGFYVRGGSADQNLILLDHAPIYYASHLFGLYSVFNSEILKSVTLYKGGIPAEYGGRLSSVLDIRTKDDRPEKITGSFVRATGIWKLNLQGPIKSKTSYMISGRRSILDVFQRLYYALDTKAPRSILYFYDFNGRLNHEFNARSKVFVSFYNGKDFFNINNLFSSDYVNTTATAGWKYLAGKRLTSNSIFTYSRFAYKLGLNLGTTSFDLKNGVEEYTLRQDFSYYADSSISLAFGLSGTYRNYSPGEFLPNSENSMFTAIRLPKYHSADWAAYASSVHKISPRITLEYGLRLSSFNLLGNGTKYIYNGAIETANITDTVHYKSLQSIKTYYGFEPRAAGRFLLNEKSSIKVSYDRMVQYMHLLSNSTSPLPQNIWMPSTSYIYPQKSHQVALGYFRNFLSDKLEFSVETYYKHIQNAADFKDNAQLLLNPNVETEVRRGFAWSYGTEFYLKGKTGKTTASISYTWSKSWMKIDGVNENRPYYASYDRRNNINILYTYDLDERWSLAANFVYATGRPMTLPAAKYNFSYVTASYYTERNGYRMPDFHHLDVAVNYYPKNKQKKHALIRIPSQKHFTFSLYNVYGRKNPYTIFTRDKKDAPGQKEVVMVYLFRWLPSISIEIKF